MAWNCRAAWLPAIEDFPSFLSRLGMMPTRGHKPCRQARSLSSESRSATRFCCELFERHCSWPDISYGGRTMERAHRLSRSMGYIAATFHKANEYPRVEPPSFGCFVRGAYRPFARGGLPCPRPLPAISPSSSAAGQSISLPPSHADLHCSEDPSAADHWPPRKCSARCRTAFARFDGLEGRGSCLR